jgi:SAM-dependent methyltransferase
VRGLLALWGRSPADPLLLVDRRDEMLEFLRSLHDDDPGQALCTYYRSGREIADLLLQVLRWRFGASLPERAVLDFASGWGRVTRFLVPELAAGRLTVSDVLPDAVAFQRRAFGVDGVVSAIRPEDLSLAGTFDAILVTSLFTHLPEARFRDWLATLWRRLRPGGVLLFSTHDSALHPAAERRGRPFLFEAASESRSLSREDYGTTWVGEPFVRATLADVCPGASAVRLPLALCNFQDLWVVAPESDAGFAGLAVQSEPELMVDRSVVEDGELVLRGWALARHGGVAAGEVVADGEVLARAPVDSPRPDVAAAYGARFGAPGWSSRCRLPGAASREGSRGATIALRVVDAAGAAHVLRVGTLDSLLAALRREQVRGLESDVHALHRELAAVRQELTAVRQETGAELARRRARIAAMEASRFWKLRNAWFAVKRALRLTDES